MIFPRPFAIAAQWPCGGLPPSLLEYTLVLGHLFWH